MLLVVNEFDTELLDLERIDVIENILKAYALKKHIVVLPKSLATYILVSEKFGLTAKHNVSSLLDCMREYKFLMKELGQYMEIDFINRDIFKLVVTGETVIRQVGYSLIHDFSKLDSVALLGEDEIDAKLYELIVNFYLKTSKNLGELTSSSIPVHGGGSKTYENYVNNKNRSVLCYCILDNDKKHPGYKLGDTAKRFSKEPHNDTYNCDFKILDIHEIECLLPFKLIEDHLVQCGNNSIKLQIFDWLLEVSKSDYNYKWFFDHKNGLLINNAMEMDAAHGDFWIEEVKKIYGQINHCDVQCIEKDCNRKKCLIVCGFGDGLSKRALEVFPSLSHVKIKEMLCPNLFEKWVEIGKCIFNWTCAPAGRTVTS